MDYPHLYDSIDMRDNYNKGFWHGIVIALMSVGITGFFIGSYLFF